MKLRQDNDEWYQEYQLPGERQEYGYFGLADGLEEVLYHDLAAHDWKYNEEYPEPVIGHVDERVVVGEQPAD